MRRLEKIKENICKAEAEDKGQKTLNGEVSINTPVGGATIVQNTNDENFIYRNGEKLPMFKGGTNALRKFIVKSLVYPDWEKSQKN